jgi:hypothetical protein
VDAIALYLRHLPKVIKEEKEDCTHFHVKKRVGMGKFFFYLMEFLIFIKSDFIMPNMWESEIKIDGNRGSIAGAIF